MKRDFAKDQQSALFGAGSTFILGSGYYLMTTPNTKSLAVQAIKSGCAAILVGLGYYKICQAQYYKELHKFYILTLDRVKDRRRSVLI